MLLPATVTVVEENWPPLLITRLLPALPAAPIAIAAALVRIAPLITTPLLLARPDPTVNDCPLRFQTVLVRKVTRLLEEPAPM